MDRAVAPHLCTEVGKGLRRRAARIIVPNEFLCKEYEHRYGIKPIVVHNPYEESETGQTIERPWPAHGGEIKVVYTGAIYHAHYDAFQNMLMAIREMRRPEIKLHLYTAQSTSDLERQNINGPVVVHSHLPQPRDCTRAARRGCSLWHLLLGPRFRK